MTAKMVQDVVGLLLPPRVLLSEYPADVQKAILELVDRELRHQRDLDEAADDEQIVDRSHKALVGDLVNVRQDVLTALGNVGVSLPDAAERLIRERLERYHVARRYLCAAGYVGECCTSVHTLVAVVEEGSVEAASTRFVEFLKSQEFDPDAQPVVLEIPDGFGLPPSMLELQVVPPNRLAEGESNRDKNSGGG